MTALLTRAQRAAIGPPAGPPESHRPLANGGSRSRDSRGAASIGFSARRGGGRSEAYAPAPNPGVAGEGVGAAPTRPRQTGSPTDQPSTSRIDNVLLGTAYHVLTDRRAVDGVADHGWLRAVVWAQREFLGRAVRRLVTEGITQFVDIGCGIPVLGATHEVAQDADPASRVVYVDKDEMTTALAHSLVRDTAHVAVVQADARNLPSVLHHPQLTGLLDLAKPVGVVAVGVLHFLDNAAEVMAQLAARLAPGSQVVVSHATADHDQYHPVSALVALYETTPTPLLPRTRDELTQLLAGFDLVGESLVPPHQWQPDPARAEDPQPCDVIPMLAGVGRLR